MLCVCVHLPVIGMTRRLGHTVSFFLPHQEGSGGSRAGSAGRVFRLCGNAQGVCADGCTWWQQKTELDQVAVSLLTLETCGDMVARKARTGTATLSHGLKAKAFLHRSSPNTPWYGARPHVGVSEINLVGDGFRTVSCCGTMR